MCLVCCSSTRIAADGSAGPQELCAEAQRLGIETHVLRPGDDCAAIAQAADADALGMAGGDGSLGAGRRGGRRARPAVRLRPVRDAQPLRPRPRASTATTRSPRWPAFARRRAARRRGPRRRAAVPEQRVARRLRGARAPARAAPPAAREPRPAARARRSRCGTRRASTSRSTASRWRRGSCSSRTTATTSTCRRSASASGSTAASSCSTSRAGFLPRSVEDRSGTRFVLDAEPNRLRVALDGEPVELETPIEFTIEPRALRVLLPPG